MSSSQTVGFRSLDVYVHLSHQRMTYSYVSVLKEITRMRGQEEKHEAEMSQLAKDSQTYFSELRHLCFVFLFLTTHSGNFFAVFVALLPK